jgi:hypothetical protein
MRTCHVEFLVPESDVLYELFESNSTILQNKFLHNGNNRQPQKRQKLPPPSQAPTILPSSSANILHRTGIPLISPVPARLSAWRRFKGESLGVNMAFLQGKKILITGLLSNRSIAYGIAQACKREGAELAFTYVGERFKDRITKFAEEFDTKLIFDCDVGSDEQINALFADLGKSWDQLDGLVHAIGYAPADAISGDFLEGFSREGFKIAHDISAYSFPAMAKAALPLLRQNSALLTLHRPGAKLLCRNFFRF